MIALGELGSTVVLLPITYLLAVLLAWLNGAPFRIRKRRLDGSYDGQEAAFSERTADELAPVAGAGDRDCHIRHRFGPLT